MIIHWNVDPVALSLGPIEVRWYGLCWAVTFLLAGELVRRRLTKLGHQGIDVAAMVMVALAGTVIGARLAHCLFYEPAT